MPTRWMRASQQAQVRMHHAATAWGTCHLVAPCPQHTQGAQRLQHHLARPLQLIPALSGNSVGSSAAVMCVAAIPCNVAMHSTACFSLPQHLAWPVQFSTQHRGPCVACNAQQQAAADITYTRESLMSLKVVKLQELLVQHGAPKSGKKEVLVERLLALQASDSSPHAATAHPSGTATVRSTQDDASNSNGQLSISHLSSRRTKRAQPTAGVVQAAHSQPEDLPAESVQLAADQAGNEMEAATRGRAFSSRRAATALQGLERHVAAPNPSTDASSKKAAQAKAATPRAAAAATTGAEAAHASVQDGLPPMPVLRRGKSWAVLELDACSEEVRNILQGNPSDMQVAVLGTAAVQASPSRSLASIAFCRSRDVWLFDAGDDTQRQLGALPHVKPSKVYRIFITSLMPETLLGLPGLLCSINAARAKGHETTDIPLHIYGPEGLADFLAPVYQVSNTYFEVAMLIVELAPGPVAPELRKPQLYNRRARMYRAIVPPDQLNPDGHYDGDLASFTPTKGRASMMRGAKAGGGVLSYDTRAGFLPFSEHQPGDPSRHVPIEQMTWTIDVDIAARITAVSLPSPDRPVFAYAIQEAERAGQLVVERADALGVPRGRSLSLLKDGVSVMNKDGKEVTPEMVLTAHKPGRRVVIMGNAHTVPDAQSAFASVTQSADLVVSGWVDAQPPAMAATRSSGCLPADQLGLLAAQLGVQHLLLSRFSSPQWLADPTVADEAVDKSAQQALEQAQIAVRSHVSSSQQAVRVDAASDFWVQVLEKHEGPAPALD